MTNKIIENLSFKDYRKMDGLNHSSLSNMDVSAEYYKSVKDEESSSTDAMKLGTAIHSAILEPDAFESDFLVYEKRRAGNDWKFFKELNADKEIIKTSDMATINRIQHNLSKNEEAIDLLSQSQRELSLTWTDTNGTLCKARIDAYKPKILIDLKSTSAKDIREFTNSAVKYFYHSQMAYYIEGLESNGLEVDEVKIIVAQTVAPYSVFVVNVPYSTIERGSELIEEWKTELIECEKTGKWGGLADEEHDLELPAWAMSDDDTSLIIDDEEVNI